MKVTKISALQAFLQLREAAESFHVAYWDRDEIGRDYHAESGLEALRRAARLIGYELKELPHGVTVEDTEPEPETVDLLDD